MIEAILNDRKRLNNNAVHAYSCLCVAYLIGIPLHWWPWLVGSTNTTAVLHGCLLHMQFKRFFVFPSNKLFLVLCAQKARCYVWC